MDKIGRNDPCPCGSGKKYKRCCLVKQGAEIAFTQDERQSALAGLERFVEAELSAEDEAAEEYFYEQWNDRLDEMDDEWLRHSEAAYDMWFFLDHRLSNGELAVDLFLDRNPQIKSGERRYLELLRDTAMRLYEVEDLIPGTSITLRDVLGGTRVTVRERLGSRSLWRNALLAARVISRGPSGQSEIETGLLQIPELVREQVVSQLSSRLESYLRERPRTGDTEFHKEMAPFLHDAWIACLLDPPIPALKNTDGEDLLFTRTRFDVADAEGLQALFDRRDELEREEEGKTVWSWLGRNAKGQSIVLGRVVLKGQDLELECNSAQRGERARAIIEELAPGTLRHRSTTHENVTMTVRDQLRSGRSNKQSSTDASRQALPREVQESLVLDHLARHYRGWLDEPIPALGDHTPREAAENSALRPKLIELIRGFEGMYQRALKEGLPAYDPSWMWGELELADGSAPAHPPPLAHERMASILPGIVELCRTVAEQMRRRPGFSDASTILTAEDMSTNLEIQRFLREEGRRLDREVSPHGSTENATASLAAHVQFMTNFELHRRKTFWVDESLAYMLAQTDLDVPGSDLRMPFPSFALVFTDRHTLSLAERMLSVERHSRLAGHFLRVATVYVTEERLDLNRIVRVGFEFDALGADPPYLVAHEIPLAEHSQVWRFLEDLAPRVVMDAPMPDCNPLRGLLRITLNAILYATSAGVEPELRLSPTGAQTGARHQVSSVIFSSENVFFLPGAIEISRVRELQELERVGSGRSILVRFMVRGHWRRAAASWKDQRLRWIEPYWKGPNIAAVIERAYRLKP